MQQGIRTLISFTAHRGNYREFPKVARLGKKLGVARVWSDRRIPCGIGAKLDRFVLTPTETRSYFELMAKVVRLDSICSGDESISLHTTGLAVSCFCLGYVAVKHREISNRFFDWTRSSPTRFEQLPANPKTVLVARRD